MHTFFVLFCKKMNLLNNKVALVVAQNPLITVLKCVNNKYR